MNLNSQTVVRGNQRIVHEDGNLEVKEVISGARCILSWVWKAELAAPQQSLFSRSQRGQDRVYPDKSKKVGFQLNSVQQGIELMLECIRVLEMDEHLGSHDRIDHEFLNVRMTRTGREASLIKLYPDEIDPITGLPMSMDHLILARVDCIALIQKLEGHKPLCDD